MDHGPLEGHVGPGPGQFYHHRGKQMLRTGHCHAGTQHRSLSGLAVGGLHAAMLQSRSDPMLACVGAPAGLAKCWTSFVCEADPSFRTVSTWQWTPLRTKAVGPCCGLQLFSMSHSSHQQDARMAPYVLQALGSECQLPQCWAGGY